MLPVTLVIVYGLPGAGKSSLCSSLLRLDSSSSSPPESYPNKHSVHTSSEESATPVQNLNRITIDDSEVETAFKNDPMHFCLNTSTRFVHVCFDSLIPFKEQERYALVARSLQEAAPSNPALQVQCSTESDSSAPWKNARRKVYSKVEQFLVQLRQCEQNVCSLNDLLSSCDFYSNSSSCDDILPPSSLVMLLDDNFYYRSMRQPYYALAGIYGAGFCEVLVTCSVDEALERNCRRCEEVRVPCEVIKRMAHKMEPAAPLSHSWEQQSLEIMSTASEEDFDRMAVLDLIQSSLSSPVVLCNTEEAREMRAAAVAESRIVCSLSVLHQADLMLRQLVAETAKKSASAENLPTVASGSHMSVKELVNEANSVRQQLLKEMKAGVSGLPQCLSEEFMPDMKQLLSNALRANFWQKMKTHTQA